MLAEDLFYVDFIKGKGGEQNGVDMCYSLPTAMVGREFLYYHLILGFDDNSDISDVTFI